MHTPHVTHSVRASKPTPLYLRPTTPVGANLDTTEVWQLLGTLNASVYNTVGTMQGLISDCREKKLSIKEKS